VTNNTMELGRSSFRVYPLKYSEYAAAREVDLARERELAERHQSFVDKTEDFIRKNIAGQKTKQAQSRRKMLDKLDKVERPEDVWASAEKVRFRFAPAPRTGDIVLDARDLGAARGGRQLFSGVELLVRRGDRVGIVGPNGAGKTTMMRMLAGRGAPEDTGTVRRGTNLHEGYFDQHLGSLDPSRTAVEEIRSVRGDLNVDGARQYLARFRFYGDDTLRRVSGYSGGERSRLCLAKMLLEPRNLLFLDEPTNHLDIPAAEILEEALMGFEGTVVLVSHDRRFLENVTTRTVSVRAGKCDVYPGGFRDFTAALAKHASTAAPSKKDEKKKDEKSREQDKTVSRAEPVAKLDRKAAFEQEKASARALERKQKRAAELEDLIAAAEAKVSALRDQLKEDPAGNWEKVANLAREEQGLSKRIDTLMAEWSALQEDLARATTGAAPTNRHDNNKGARP
jgi:ATP-binding cassette subfamily F protein 3